MLITIASVVFGLGSAYVLLPSLGIVSASVARGVATVVSLGLTIFALKRMHALSLDVTMAWKSLLAGAVMAATLLVAQAFAYSTILLPAYIFLGLVVYLVLLRVLKAIEASDLRIIQEYLGARFASLAGLLGAMLVSQGSLSTVVSRSDKCADRSLLSEVTDREPNADVISVNRAEWDALLTDNRLLLTQMERLVRKGDALEGEKLQLTTALKSANTTQGPDEATLPSAADQHKITMRQAREILGRLTEQTDKRITRRNTRI